MIHRTTAASAAASPAHPRDTFGPGSSQAEGARASPPHDRPQGSPSSALDEEEFGAHADQHSPPQQQYPLQKTLYIPGDMILDQSRLPTLKPLLMLLFYLLSTALTSRQHLPGTSKALRLTELEVTVVTSMLLAIASAAESLLTRPALTLHPVAVVEYVKLLPWSLSFLLFLTLGDAVHATLSNWYLAAAYSGLCSVGLFMCIALFGYRCKRVGTLAALSFAATAALMWMLIGGRFPSEFVPAHVCLWAICFTCYCRLTPAYTTSHSPVTAHPSASPSPPRATSEVGADTLAFVCSVSCGAVAAVALFAVLPSYFPIPFGDVISHVVVGRFWSFLFAFWARSRLQSCLLAFQLRACSESTVGLVGIVGALLVCVCAATGLLVAPVPSIQNITATLPNQTRLVSQYFLLLMALLLVLYRNGRDMLQCGLYLTSDSGRFPFHFVSILSFADAARLSTAIALWTIIRMLGSVCTLIAPEGLTFFASPQPVPCGPGLIQGVAVLATPPTPSTGSGSGSGSGTSNSAAEGAVRPNYFVFNAGNLQGSQRGSDWLSTAKATASIASQFAGDPDFGGAGTGFAGNLVMEFSIYSQPTRFRPFASLLPVGHRQFNLSGWKDPESAGMWYAKNGTHKEVVRQYYDNDSDDRLKTFQAMLCSLKPARPVVYQNRCRPCARVVYGYPEVLTCPDCHEPLPPMPLF